MQDFFANSDEEFEDKENPFAVARKSSKKLSRPHFASGDLDLNDTVSAGLFSGEESDDLMGHVNLKLPVSPRHKNITQIEKFINDIGYRH